MEEVDIHALEASKQRSNKPYGILKDCLFLHMSFLLIAIFEINQMLEYETTVSKILSI